MFHKDELFSNSNILVDMVNLCSFFRGGVFSGEGAPIHVLIKKNVSLFSCFFNKIINNTNTRYTF